MSTAEVTRVDLDKPRDVWRFECPERHGGWRLAGDSLYCATCASQGLGSGHTKLWDKAEEREVPVSELEFVADRKEWRL